MRRPGLFSRSFFRSSGRPAAVLFGLGCLLAPRLSTAHILLSPPPTPKAPPPPPTDWLVPNSEGDPQKITPCGADPTATTTYTPSNKINTVTVGDKLTIYWRETVLHDGHFRISLAASRADLTDPATVNNTDGTAKSAAISTAYPVLADNLFPHLISDYSPATTKDYSYTITIPNMPCAKCTLQLLQFMANHPLDPSYFYHHCADMQILAAPTGAGGTTGGGGAGTSGSAGTAGGAGVSGGAGTSGNAGSNGAGGVTGSGTAGTGVASGTAGVTGSGTAGVTGSGTAGVTGNGTAGVTGSSGTAGVTGSGTAGTGVASGTGGSSGGTGTAPTSGGGCQTAGRTGGLGAFGLCAIALLVGRRARRARRR